ncbi:MAG: PASTA domain-containing protein [Bacteroidales bacterium]|nr:PASTA domain-containing protein [Bacteroidales bacterium]
MSFLNIIKSKAIWKHIGIQIGIVVIILTFIYFWLSSYTFHGESIDVPDLSNMTFEEAEHTAELHDLKVVLSDSVHFLNKPKGVVISQVPAPKSKVKPERTIYLIINGFNNEKIAMPDLRGISLRQATADAELFGLKIGKLTYVPDISTTVLKQLYKGKEIEPQTMIPVGSTIDLVVGKGESNEKTEIVCVVGKTLEEANTLLSAASLNIGTVTKDATIKNAKDSIRAFIWKQSPSCNNNNAISLGSYIDLWITLDKDLLPETNETNEINF